MLVSINWLRSFLDLPDDLDPRDLGERFTRTSAEVETVRPVHVAARGLIAARVLEVETLGDTADLRVVTLDVGGGRSVQSVTAAPVLHRGGGVVFAPAGAAVGSLGEIGVTRAGGRESSGLILPADALGIGMAFQEAVHLDGSVAPGQSLDGDLFEDWVFEVDNKSITHRPDLWGHYGIAREIAAILKIPLKPYPAVPLAALRADKLPAVPIDIADASACPRYSALVVEGVPTQPAPLWMQLLLGHIGLRPISGLVDLTNFIMADLGQPMHAFDAAGVDRIEVDWASDGERFQTLDGTERRLTASDLMIKSGGKSVALAGVMGGLETEVGESTTSLLLESANFHPAVIRRTAGRLGLRTDASARFEKSLDPAHTVLAIQRFIGLARSIYPDLRLTSTLSDAYPAPKPALTVAVDAGHVARTIGREVPFDEIQRLLRPLEFDVTGGAEVSGDGGTLAVCVPSFRATADVTIEADVIEEIARFIGYDNIPPAMPRVTVRRFAPNALHELEQQTLRDLTTGHGFHEIHGYIWYDAAWLKRLGIDAGRCIELSNPAADGLHHLRRSLIPGLLAAVTKNRFHFPALDLVELGSVFEAPDREFRHVALVCAAKDRKAEPDLFDRLKGALEAWSWRRFATVARFSSTPSDAPGPPAPPWQHTHRSAAVTVAGRCAGSVSVVGMALRQAMDEHLVPWSIAWAELRLTGLEGVARSSERLSTVPAFPVVEMDVSFLVPAETRFETVAATIGEFRHPLVKRIRYVGAFEGDAVGGQRRSLTLRVVVGHDTRTLKDRDTADVRAALEQHLTAAGYELRR